MYVHNSMVEFLEASQKSWFYAIFSEMSWFQTKRFTGFLELIQLYKTKPIREICHFPPSPKLDTLALIHTCRFFDH